MATGDVPRCPQCGLYIYPSENGITGHERCVVCNIPCTQPPCAYVPSSDHDIVKRLRANGSSTSFCKYDHIEAADRIESLRNLLYAAYKHMSIHRIGSGLRELIGKELSSLYPPICQNEISESLD
jgi:hypothetical protein